MPRQSRLRPWSASCRRPRRNLPSPLTPPLQLLVTRRALSFLPSLPPSWPCPQRPLLPRVPSPTHPLQPPFPGRAPCSSAPPPRPPAPPPQPAEPQPSMRRALGGGRARRAHSGPLPAPRRQLPVAKQLSLFLWRLQRLLLIGETPLKPQHLPSSDPLADLGIARGN